MLRHHIRTFVPALCALALLTAAPATAQETPAGDELRVTSAAVATDVQEREPVGADDSFRADVGRLYFHTTLEGDFGETSLVHVWLHDGAEVARVPMTVRGPRWRTWSSKEIAPDRTGDWEVRVVDTSGEVLETASFTVGAD